MIGLESNMAGEEGIKNLIPSPLEEERKDDMQ
jgi:hypothetical protein